MKRGYVSGIPLVMGLGFMVGLMRFTWKGEYYNSSGLVMGLSWRWVTERWCWGVGVCGDEVYTRRELFVVFLL